MSAGETDDARLEAILAGSRSVRVKSPWSEAARQFGATGWQWRVPVILIVLSLMAIFAPVVGQHDPNRGDFRRIDQSPSMEHWLGTDGNGRDYWSRLVDGRPGLCSRSA